VPRTFSKTQLERQAALARLEVEELSASVDDARTAGDTDQVMQALDHAIAALRETLNLPFGLRIEQTAKRLGVSKPTAKKWMDEGFLERVPGRSPAEVTQGSVVRVERILDDVRHRFPARSWTQQLAAFLHDRDLQGQDWFREGVEQGERGEYVEL
jgi:DNA-binding transcriptional regulator YiaG